VKLGQILKEIVEQDENIRYIILKGEWKPIFTKKNFVVIEDNINKRTLVLMKKVIPIMNKNFEVKGFDKVVEWILIHRVMNKQEIEELYKKFKRNRGKLFNCAKGRHRIKLSRKAKKIDDRQRLKINLERQQYIRQKIKELENEYDKIKYKRKEPYRTRKKELRRLMENYKLLLEQLKQAYYQLLEELNKKEIVNEELLP